MKTAALIFSVAADAAILYLFLRLALSKSLTAAIAEGYLLLSGYRKRFSKRKSFEGYYALKMKENAEPFALPDKFRPRAPLTRAGDDNMPVCVFNKDNNGTVILYLHGGAYVNRPQKMHWKFLDRLALKTGAQIHVPLYPLLPQGDGPRAFSAVSEYYRSLSPEKHPVVLMGDSAGAGLAAAIAAAEASKPEKLILISPWVDVSMQNPDLADYDRDPLCALYGLRRLGEMWAKDCGTQDPRVSPVNGCPESLENVAVFAGARELLYPDIVRFCNKIPNVRMIVQRGVHHDYPLYPTPEARKAARQIRKLLKSDR